MNDETTDGSHVGSSPKTPWRLLPPILPSFRSAILLLSMPGVDLPAVRVNHAMVGAILVMCGGLLVLWSSFIQPKTSNQKKTAVSEHHIRWASYVHDHRRSAYMRASDVLENDGHACAHTSCSRQPSYFWALLWECGCTGRMACDDGRPTRMGRGQGGVPWAELLSVFLLFSVYHYCVPQYYQLAQIWRYQA